MFIRILKRHSRGPAFWCAGLELNRGRANQFSPAEISPVGRRRLALRAGQFAVLADFLRAFGVFGCFETFGMLQPACFARLRARCWVHAAVRP